MPSIDFNNFTISGDEDSYCLSFSGTARNLVDWKLCIPGETLIIEVNTNFYTFKIDSRSRSRVFGEDNYSVEARSPTSVLGEGATPIYKSWGAITAQAVCQEMCDLYGITLNYQIVNWNIPGGRLTADGATPISIINLIAEAAGAIVQTDLDGTLNVIYRHPMSPVNYDLNNVALTISDVDDIFNLDETSELNPKYNAVEVMDIDANNQSSDSIQLATDEDLTDMVNNAFANLPPSDTVRIKVIRFPFVSSVDLYTSANGVTITSLGKYYREITEMIEVVNGEGRTSELVSSLGSYTYQDADLGALSTDGTTVITEIEEQSLVNITYTTEFHVFDVYHAQDRSIQVYIEE